MSKTSLAKDRVELYSTLARSAFFKYIGHNIQYTNNDNIFSKFLDFTPDFIKSYVGQSFSNYNCSSDELSQASRFKTFYSWYLQYANLRLDDNLTIERINAITSEEVYNCPSPLYLSTAPIIKGLASKLAVYSLIPIVEIMANAYSIASSIHNKDTSIFINKFINTATIILNRYTLLPDIYGLIEGICTTKLALSLRYTEHNRIGRDCSKQEADARRLNNYGIKFFEQYPHLRKNIYVMYQDKALQCIFMGNNIDMPSELLCLCELFARLSLQDVKTCDHSSLDDISKVEKIKYTKLDTLYNMYKLSANKTELNILISRSIETIINSPTLYQNYDHSPSRVRKSIQAEITPRLYNLVQEIRATIYQEVIEEALGVLPPENGLYFAKPSHRPLPETNDLPVNTLIPVPTQNSTLAMT